MNILSAIYSGQTGFLKATASASEKAARIAESDLSKPGSDTDLVSNLVGSKIDSVQAKASSRVISIADNVLKEFVSKLK